MSAEHLGALAVIACAISAMVVAARARPGPWIRVLAIVLVVDEVSWWIYLLAGGVPGARLAQSHVRRDHLFLGPGRHHPGPADARPAAALPELPVLSVLLSARRRGRRGADPRRRLEALSPANGGGAGRRHHSGVRGRGRADRLAHAVELHVPAVQTAGRILARPARFVAGVYPGRGRRRSDPFRSARRAVPNRQSRSLSAAEIRSAPLTRLPRWACASSCRSPCASGSRAA